MNTRLPVLALAVAAVTAGCVDNQASVQMVGVCSLPESSCTFPASCTVFYGGDYAWDVAVGDEMVLPVQVRNQVEPVARDGVSVNTNDAKVTKTVTEYSVVGTAAVENPSAPGTFVPLTIPTSTAYIAEHVNAGGEGVVFAKPFSSTVTSYLNGLLKDGDDFLVIARMRLEGSYDNGSTFKTGSIDIPVHVCSGCVAAPTCTAPAKPVACPAVGQQPSTGAGCG